MRKKEHPHMTSSIDFIPTKRWEYSIWEESIKSPPSVDAMSDLQSNGTNWGFSFWSTVFPLALGSHIDAH